MPERIIGEALESFGKSGRGYPVSAPAALLREAAAGHQPESAGFILDL
ncbi:hypothetical protein JQ636_04240 [Bradyrhizobium japonicum]|nr:hypothetical protein [Bradyrhizobium japonicum]MBR0728317.1 hypothetical protein [Bradyrhizobium japonicum]MBR0802739.1 hypothetical protein [Bradyrhizobium japonicum]